MTARNVWASMAKVTCRYIGGDVSIAGARAIATSAHGHNIWIVADVFWYQSLILRSSCS